MSVFFTPSVLFPLLLLAPTSLFEGVPLAHSLRQESGLLSGVIDSEADVAVQHLDAEPR